ncbi:RNA polymerase I termination factor [Cinnamomum micranthum f. kanehirae]|uniref:RNA polymerase I termination factor n=1 Tax=Cinnamomum micranthum f. kanehirae TaxID=337451 RepID=A0A443N797_9MAGN|nr:RNA polymerase I termination factor [Cinnamomum micranthum f. kanehirae]
MSQNDTDSSSDTTDELWHTVINSYSDEELQMLYRAALEEERENLRRRMRVHRGSIQGCAVIHRGRISGHHGLYNDYFSENPVYTASQFRMRLRMHKPLFLRIVNAVEAHDPYFQQKRNYAGRLSLSVLQKVTAAVRMLAYGVTANAMDNYMRIAETIIDVFGSEYLRTPNNADIKRLLSEGRAPSANYSINGHEYTTCYYLADGIYPSWVTFIKTIPCLNGPKATNFATAQESARKDVERAFGVLQAHFAIVRGPARFWDRQTLQHIMKACIIMHNMIIEDERDQSLPPNYDAREGECSDFLVSRDHTAEFQDFIQNHLCICDKRTHSQLQADLVEHLNVRRTKICMWEEEVGELQKRGTKGETDNKMKKDKSAVAEELTEYGGVIDKDLPSRHVYFSDNNEVEKIRKKSKDHKRKKQKGTDTIECTDNDRDRHSLDIDSYNVVRAVKVGDNKNTMEERKRGDDMEKSSHKNKKKAADDERIREDSNHMIGEDVKVRKKVANYEEAAEDNNDHPDTVASKNDCVKESKVLNEKVIGNNKRNNNVKSMDNEKDVQELRKVSNVKEVRKDKDRTNGDGKKKVEHVKEGKNGKRTESCLTQAIAGEPTKERKKAEYTKGSSDKVCITLNRKQEAVGVKLGKHKKKKSKNVREEEVEAVKSISKEISDEGFEIDERAKDKEAAKVNVNNGELNIRKRKVNADHSTNFSPKKKSKSVSFSERVEVFPLSNDKEHEEDDPLPDDIEHEEDDPLSYDTENEEQDFKDNLVQGKRFSIKEDALVKESVENYIRAHDLGERGLDMILHCSSHPEVRGCWPEIGSALPWRPYTAVYSRAHVLYERSEERKWEPDEYDALRRHHEKHGANWKALAEVMGKHRFHIKDAWRRSKLPNLKRGLWSQDEYQTLFDLVNMDLRMKAFEEKKTKHGMLRDNIAWEAISEKMSTRTNPNCCVKWYSQLASPMVAEGKWDNADDYRLIKVDASCVDDVDWDNLLNHRSGEVCLKRWKQMTKYIGEYRDKTFPEQVELLATRFVPNLLEVLERENDEFIAMKQ